jgi:hypothetical protein
MNTEGPLIPRPYIRAAVATGILLALIAGSVWVGSYVISTMQ